MQQDKKLIQEKKEELYSYEKLIDNIDQDLTNIKQSSPDDYQKFKDFASKKKRQVRETIKSLKEEIFILENKNKKEREVMSYEHVATCNQD